MNTIQLINLYTATASNMMNVFNAVGHLNSQQEEDMNVYSLLSEAIRPVRDIYESLPDELQTLSHEDISQCYIHNHRAADAEIRDFNIGTLESACFKLHGHAYDLWNEMDEARKKFDLS